MTKRRYMSRRLDRAHWRSSFATTHELFVVSSVDGGGGGGGGGGCNCGEELLGIRDLVRRVSICGV